MGSTFRQDLLAGKVALVTGGGSGICKGIAAAFVAHGADVGIVGRKADRLEAAAAELASSRRCSCIARSPSCSVTSRTFDSRTTSRSSPFISVILKSRCEGPPLPPPR